MANGFVFANTERTLSAFDADGVHGCSGTPKTCAPLWTYDGALCSMCGLDGPPSTDGRFVYVSSHAYFTSSVSSFDAAGRQGCTGVPKRCEPLHSGTAPDEAFSADGPVTIGRDVVYINNGMTTAFTADELTPLWQTSAGWSSPTLANGVLYTINAISESTPGLYRLLPVAHDANGHINCTGTPKTCAPIWKGPPGELVGDTDVVNPKRVGPAIANGRLYVLTDRLRVYAAP